jgi:hypothetical protein
VRFRAPFQITAFAGHHHKSDTSNINNAYAVCSFGKYSIYFALMAPATGLPL